MTYIDFITKFIIHISKTYYLNNFEDITKIVIFFKFLYNLI